MTEPNPFYPPELTDRSRRVLDTVVQATPGVVLIGGWAIWVRTGGPMSHDIDLIVTHQQLATIAELGTDTSESHHLSGRKWRTTIDGIHLDLYVPYQSRLGQRLQLRIEHLATDVEIVDGWTVLDLPAHIASKLAALTDRPHTAPGIKDRYELAALILRDDADSTTTMTTLAKASAQPAAELAATITAGLDHLDDGTLPPRIRRELQRPLRAWHTAIHQLRPRHDPDQRDHHAPRRR
ncbi:MAG TPA: hypothetical protein VGA69_09025 [Nitriliruptorales bacterium]